LEPLEVLYLLERMRIDANGNTGIGNTAPTDKLSVNGTLAVGNTTITGFANVSTTITSGGIISAPGANGFISASYVSNARNPIWRFGNADGYGFSYFQGNTGADGTYDTIGFHFGTATAIGSPIQFNQTGSTKATLNITGTANVSVSVNTALLSVGTSFTANTTRVAIGTSTALQANGGIGTAYQILHSNGTSDYWENQALRSSGQQVIDTSQTLGVANYGSNILVVTGGITVTLPTSSSIPSGMGITIKNISGANITISYAHSGDGQTNIQNNQAAVWFADGGASTFWRQYFLSTNA